MLEWSPNEDRRPAAQTFSPQPEKTARGEIWTQYVRFDWPAPGYTYMTIRDCSGQFLIGHGRVYPLQREA